MVGTSLEKEKETEQKRSASGRYPSFREYILLRTEKLRTKERTIPYHCGCKISAQRPPCRCGCHLYTAVLYGPKPRPSPPRHKGHRVAKYVTFRGDVHRQEMRKQWKHDGLVLESYPTVQEFCKMLEVFYEAEKLNRREPQPVDSSKKDSSTWGSAHERRAWSKPFESSKQWNTGPPFFRVPVSKYRALACLCWDLGPKESKFIDPLVEKEDCPLRKGEVQLDHVYGMVKQWASADTDVFKTE